MVTRKEEKSMTQKPRLMLTISEDIVNEVREAKKGEQYFDKPYSELYRDLIVLGLEALKQQHSANR